MRVTVLSYCETEADVAAHRYDPVVAQVGEALRAGGHHVAVLGVHGSLPQMLRGLERQRPDLVFNLAEMFGSNVIGDVALIGVLELLDLAYTGCSVGEAYLTQDKALGKKLLAFHNILFPRFAIFSKANNLETGGNLRLPLFVKPAHMDASIGIDKAGIVRDANALMRRVLAIHEECNDDALAEEYIEGRELYVSVLGPSDGEPRALPAIEIDFSGLPQGAPHVMDARAKFDTKSAAFRGTRARLAELPDELRAKVQAVALGAYRALRVRDYGRVDMRVNASGEIYVLEVNAACYLERSAEFAMAASAAGLAYTEIIQQIADMALARGKHHERRGTPLATRKNGHARANRAGRARTRHHRRAR